MTCPTDKASPWVTGDGVIKYSERIGGDIVMTYMPQGTTLKYPLLCQHLIRMQDVCNLSHAICVKSSREIWITDDMQIIKMRPSGEPR